MKHVFIAHSHTLLLTSIGVVRYLELDEHDVLFICTRHFHAGYFPAGCTTVRADEEYDRWNVVIESGVRGDIRKTIKEVDEHISKWIGERYQLYVPHLANPVFLLLYHHPDCTRVSYVQEGAFTVKGMFVNRLSAIYKLRRRFALFRHKGSLRFYGIGLWYCDGVLDRQKRVDAYAIYRQFFQYLPCDLHLVDWPDINVDNMLGIDGPVFVFDGYVKNHMAAEDYYLSRCDMMAERFHGEKNYLKFHPAQSEDERTRICRMFESRALDYTVMDDLIPFELYIIKNSHMTVVGMSSSLLYYAQQRGHTVVCCDTWMLGDPSYRKFRDAGAPLFHEYFEDALEVK